jgi:hypothetical protein
MKSSFCIAIALGLGLGVGTMVPELITPTSADALVNAETAAPPPDTSRQDALKMELAAQQHLLRAFSEEDRQLQVLEAELTERAQSYRKAAVTRLGLALAESQAKLAAAEASQARTRAELDRKKQLAGKGLAATAALQAARSEDDEATAAVQAAQANLAKVTAELEAISQGVFTVGAGDAPYADQRRDEVRMRRAGRGIERAQAEVRAAELRRQLEIAVAGTADAAMTTPRALAGLVTGS